MQRAGQCEENFSLGIYDSPVKNWTAELALMWHRPLNTYLIQSNHQCPKNKGVSKNPPPTEGWGDLELNAEES
jgi:hypothetical protein